MPWVRPRNLAPAICTLPSTAAAGAAIAAPAAVRRASEKGLRMSMFAQLTILHCGGDTLDDLAAR
jgi:hypothetical protein